MQPEETPDKLNAWRSCTKCGLYQTRKNVVIGRGVIPADLLFIGEAPGKTEDLLREAFVGSSGRLLTKAMEAAAKRTNRQPTFYITNIIACRPCDSKHSPNRQPTKEEAAACWDRLSQTENLVQPASVVFLGKIAQKYGAVFSGYLHTWALQHPAYILRRGGYSSPEYQLFINELCEVYKHGSN